MRPDTEQKSASGEQRPPTGHGHPQAGAVHVATLSPTQPPGRITRKARYYVTQIVQLRGQGYTLEAIQQALAAVGVHVSLSTVRREGMRPVLPAPRQVVAPSAALSSAPVAAAPAPDPTQSLSPGPPSTAGLPPSSDGKDIAAAFANGKSTNALTRAKERS